MKAEANRLKLDLKDAFDCSMNGKFSKVVKNSEYVSAGLTEAQSVDGKLTTDSICLLFDKMSKQEREDLLGKDPKFFTFDNMKKKAIEGAKMAASAAIHEAGAQIGAAVGDAIGGGFEGAGDGFADMLAEKVAEKAEAKFTSQVDGEIEGKTEAVNSYFAAKLSALDSKPPPPFRPSKEGCYNIMDKGTGKGTEKLLYRVVGAHYEKEGLVETRFYAAEGSIEVPPLVTVVADPEGDPNCVLVLKDGEPIAVIKKLKNLGSTIEYYSMEFAGTTFLGRSRIEVEGNPHGLFVTKGPIEDPRPVSFYGQNQELVGFSGGKRFKGYGPFEVIKDATECGPGMDLLSFMCFQFAVMATRTVKPKPPSAS